ncbi:hypothetical protein SEVIR_2G398700v4 [Setaria viridis]|uniref:Pentacotripeptide-repeat region of PRORP domain-containing protein n=1 Tax=Setaria viridis TaxID=4556 RepID=A0A4U6W1G8_SETVI|nr:pentatricopeptide repeat-containing protein At1g62670, mitochondrial-like [Setaria viridis]XP_034581165.1 pentatricopeptide repeat-containing protein At1g62670, mitochondrial-like [Setaria viridis]XP_034581167.1 pentatricopeptide repeat-containing protein At1g62670, mitochondrial-like [Setaria viridis]TKW35802.1 hypothetical protein SEVIR_2G398700v2 [Setaria viridis]
MRRAVPGFLRRAHAIRSYPPVLRLSSQACCLNSSDNEEPGQSSAYIDYRSQCLLPSITLAVRTANWDAARNISFRECVRLYGLSQSIGLFALLVQLFLPRRIREIRCLIQSIVDYCGNAGQELFELAPILVSRLGGSMTLLQIYAAVIRIFVELSMFEDALLTYIEAKEVGAELRLCNFLLKCLVKGNQIVYARSLFDDMKSSGPSPNVYSYSVLMSMYTHGERLCLEEAFELLREMEMNGVRPNAATYGTYLYGLCRSRQVTSAWDFLQNLCQRGCPCNTYCFNAVIHGFCTERQVHKAIEVFNGMKKCGFLPDVHSYSILVDGLCKQGELLKGYDMLDEMARNGISPNHVSYSSLLHGLCKTGNVEFAFEIFKRLKDQGFKHDQIMYSILFHGSCQHLHLDIVNGLWDDMIHHDFVLDVYDYTNRIYALCRHRCLIEALEVFELMLENGITPNIVTCTILVDGFSKEGLIGEAFLFLDKVHQSLAIAPNLYTYKAIINGLCKINKSNDVWELFADMIKRGYVPDAILYSIIIDGFVKALELQEAFRLYHKMLDEGIKPTIFTCTSLLNGLCHDDGLPRFRKLMRDMIGEDLVLDKILCTSIIAHYCRRSNMKAAMEMYKKMESSGLSPDAFVYTCLISGFSKVRAMDGALLMMEEMEKRNIKPTVVTYTALIVGYLKTGDEKQANKMYRSMCEASIDPDDKLSCILGVGNDGGD